MKSESTYLAAKMVAETVEQRFRHHIEAARSRGEQILAPLPSALTIESMIDTAFWAGLRREEGHSPKISLAFLPPSMAGTPVLFEEKLPLTPGVLTKISPGVERPGIHLGIWQDGDELFVWGTTLKIPNLCFVLDVSEPGLLVIKHRRFEGFGKFANVAVLTGDQVKIVDGTNISEPDSPDLLKSLLSSDSPGYWSEAVNVLVQLAVSMRAHGHGGSLLVVPTESDTWKQSIIHPLKYAVNPPYAAIKNLLTQKTEINNSNPWQTALKNEIENLAGLTAIDGATVMSNQFELFAFGAKIGRPEGNRRVEKIFYSEPVVGGDAVIVNPAQSGGTRHLSAAQFVSDQKDAVALVASQDGHFTIFSWSPRVSMVQAHRIDSLLL